MMHTFGNVSSASSGVNKRPPRSGGDDAWTAWSEMPPWRLLTEDVEAVWADTPARLPKFGWQQKVVGQEVHLPRLTEPERVMMRLQHGPLVSSALTGCGRQLDSLGHHRTACSEARVLGKKGVST